MQPSCTILCSGTMPQTLTVPPQIMKKLLAISCTMNLFGSSVTSSSCLSSSFHRDFKCIRSSLVSSSCAHQWSYPLIDLAPASSWELLSCWRPLWTPCPSSQIHENCEQTAVKFLPNLFHGDGPNFMPSKAMFSWPCSCYSLSKTVTRFFLIHHSALLSNKKCDVNNIS